jgi:hypothetical protein
MERRLPRRLKRAAAAAALGLLASTALAQTPEPFPRPPAQRPQPQAPTNQSPPPAGKLPPTPQRAAPAQPDDPTEAMLGLPIYPGSQFMVSYNAGRGQRYYLFGTNADFAQAVTFYRTALKQRGELVYEEPPIHMFEVGRFREETMAFPPGVTVKDYTWAGSAGYLNPKRGAEPARFKTVIQIVPAPAGAAGR